MVDQPHIFVIFLIAMGLVRWYWYLPESHILKYYTLSFSFSTTKETAAGSSAGWYVIYFHIKRGPITTSIILFSATQEN